MKKLILFLIFCVSSWLGVSGQNTVRISNQTVTPDQTFWVEVEVNNASPFVALQMDLTLPAALSLDLSSAMLNPARTSGHDIQASVLTGNILRVICFSAENKAFNGVSGYLFRFQMTAGKVPGNYTLTPANVVMGNDTGTSMTVTITPGTIQLLAPNISLNLDSLNFGSTAVSQQTSRSVIISNTGTQSLAVTSVTNPDNQFTISPAAPFNIAAGGNQQLTITFKPTWKGTFSLPITIQSSDPDQPSSIIKIQANAYTINEIHVGNLSVFSGAHGQLIIAVNNMEAFTGFQFDLVLPTSMTYLPDSIWFTGRTINHQITANPINNNRLRVVGYSLDNNAFTGTSGNLIKISFNVQGTGGSYGIGIENGIIGEADGTNILSAVYSGTLQIAAPDIDCSTSLAFGEVSSIDSKTMDLVVRNYGNDKLVLSASDFNNPAFSLVTALPLEIPIGQNKTISVKYQNAAEGSQTGRLRLFSNDPDENPFTINLTGSTFIPNRVYIENKVVILGNDVFLDVAVRNYEEFVALQFDLTFAKDTFSLDIDHIETTSRLSDHQVQGIQLSAGKIRVLAYSLTQQKATGEDGSVLRIPVSLLIQKSGKYSFMMENVILGNSKAENILRDAVGGVLTLRGPEIIIGKHLNLGWTWFSINVEPPSWAIADVLQSISPAENDYIKNQTASATYYAEYGWFGDITVLNPKQLYKIKLASASEFSLTGPPANPADYPISLVAGWNWVGYLPQTAQVLNTVFTGFPVTANDYIKNQLISTTYYAEWGWFGDIATLAPMDGYMMKLGHAGTLTYTDGGEPLKTLDDRRKTEDGRQEDFGTLKRGDFEFSMQITATMVDQSLIRRNPDLALVAYSGEEVRGYLLPVLFPPTGEWVYDGLVYGNQSEGEELCFKLISNGKETGIATKGQFAADGRIGNGLNPLVLKLKTDHDDTWEASVYPNPSWGSLNVSISTTSISPISIKILDMQGRAVMTKTFDQVMAGKQNLKVEVGSIVGGSYTLIISQDNKISTKQIIVK